MHRLCFRSQIPPLVRLTMSLSILAVGVKDAAAALNISHWSIRKYIRQGRLRAVRIGRRVLIEPAELQRLIAQGRTEVQE